MKILIATVRFSYNEYPNLNCQLYRDYHDYYSVCGPIITKFIFSNLV